nr:FtsX-like permease family protein [Treponema sp.]
GTEYSVNVTSMQSMLEQMSKITSTISLLLSAIAAISLLVGGIGIMNIMIVTVTERKQEIGIRKALGASPKDIRQQFLVESASITLLGGIMGIILGIIISLAVEYIQSQALTINTKACIISFVFSVFVGIFFGLNPAIRAAKLDPVIALSGE